MKAHIIVACTSMITKKVVLILYMPKNTPGMGIRKNIHSQVNTNIKWNSVQKEFKN